jgi:hypothetical protein
MFFRFWTCHPAFSNLRAPAGLVLLNFSIVVPNVSTMCIIYPHSGVIFLIFSIFSIEGILTLIWGKYKPKFGGCGVWALPFLTFISVNVTLTFRVNESRKIIGFFVPLFSSTQKGK